MNDAGLGRSVMDPLVSAGFVGGVMWADKNPAPTGIDATLAERGARYGSFVEHARLAQGMKAIMQTGRRWAELPDDMKETLEMVAHKIGRILNGDPDYIDSWHDIIGYVKLVENRLNGIVQ